MSHLLPFFFHQVIHIHRELVDMQQQGAEIISVAPYGLGDGKTARCVIVYRAPMHDDLRPGR